MPSNSERAPSAQAPVVAHSQPVAKVAFLVIAGALGAVSIGLAAYVAADRGVDLPSRLAWGTVGAALALGLLLAPAEAAAFVRRRQWGAAFVATLLALTCAAFVLTGALGNAAAGRQATAQVADHTSGHRARLTHEHEMAKQELDELPPSRLVGEIEADITPLNAVIGDLDCATWLPRKAVRNACAQRSPLLAEMARAERRAELKKTIRETRTALDAPMNTRPANADAAIIAKFIGALGMSVQPDHVADVLIIIAVLSLEAGGALALVLARAQAVQTAGASSVQPVQPPSARARRARSEQCIERAGRRAQPSAERSANVVPLRRAERSIERAQLERAMAGIIEHAERGSLPSAQRAMARLLNVSVGTISTALAEIERSGIARVNAQPNGTFVTLNRSASA